MILTKQHCALSSQFGTEEHNTVNRCFQLAHIHIHANCMRTIHGMDNIRGS